MYIRANIYASDQFGSQMVLLNEDRILNLVKLVGISAKYLLKYLDFGLRLSFRAACRVIMPVLCSHRCSWMGSQRIQTIIVSVSPLRYQFFVLCVRA